MSEDDLSIFAHLMRRAGFGATRTELDCLAAKGYEAVVEDLVNPERLPEFEADLEGRYFGNEGRRGAGGWFYRMVNSQRQLEEKIQFFNSEPRFIDEFIGDATLSKASRE